MKTTKLTLAGAIALSAVALAGCGSAHHNSATTSKNTITVHGHKFLKPGTSAGTGIAHAPVAAPKTVFRDGTITITSEPNWTSATTSAKATNSNVLYAASPHGQPKVNLLQVSSATAPKGGLTAATFVKNVVPVLSAHGDKASLYAINTIGGIAGYIAYVTKGSGPSNSSYVEYLTIGKNTYSLSAGPTSKKLAWVELVELMSNTKWKASLAPKATASHGHGTTSTAGSAKKK